MGREVGIAEVGVMRILNQEESELYQQSTRMRKLYLCSDEKLIADATVFGPFTNEGFRRTILAVVESSQLGSSEASAKLTKHSQCQ